MSWQIPPETRYSFKLRSRGIVVWAIQRNLRSLGYSVAIDGNYGHRTESRVAEFQEAHGLVVDGIFGPASSREMATQLELSTPGIVPRGLLRGFVDGESDGHVGAVNHSSPGGVDLSYLQRRVLTGADDAAIQRAFNGLYQFTLLARTTRGRYFAYLGRPGATSQERAGRLACLFHNYQYAADKLAQGPWQTEYSLSVQEWVVDIGAHFDDGNRVETPLEWCDFYALGSPAHDHPGHVTRLVTDWSEWA